MADYSTPMLITGAEIRSGSTHTLFDSFYAQASAKGVIRHGNP